MPKYDYECPGEGITKEFDLPMEHKAPFCDTCGALMARVFAPISVHFKGKGFYKTDNK
jgi:predicted nucleic acid-binding Zn ribbon protein